LVEYKFLLNCCKLRGKTLEINKEENKLVVSDDNTVFENAVNDTDVELFEDKKFEEVGIKLSVD